MKKLDNGFAALAGWQQAISESNGLDPVAEAPGKSRKPLATMASQASPTISPTRHIEEILKTDGMFAAYQEALRTIHKLATELDVVFASRFFERRIMDDHSKKLIPTTERAISEAYDLEDLSGEMSEFLYCDDDGVLYPVTVAGKQRQSPAGVNDEYPFVYAESNLVANEKIVGQVKYTDH